MNQELLDAKARARQLLDNLVAQQQDLEMFASRKQVVLAPEKLAAGRRALASAVESTRQTVEQIDQASNTAR
jgi:hypothetical protein